MKDPQSEKEDYSDTQSNASIQQFDIDEEEGSKKFEKIHLETCEDLDLEKVIEYLRKTLQGRVDLGKQFYFSIQNFDNSILKMLQIVKNEFNSSYNGINIQFGKEFDVNQIPYLADVMNDKHSNCFENKYFTVNVTKDQ